MKEDGPTNKPSAAALHAALLDYYSAPGRYQLSLRQPAALFASVREILQIAAGRGSRADASDATLREAAAFFIRAALLYPGADHYAVMGFASGTEPTDLKERYRLLMRLIHPDFAEAGIASWPADAAVRVNRAHEVLASPRLRREYEEQLATLKQHRSAGAAKATSHAPAAVARRKHEPRLQVGKRAAWALGISLTGMGVLMLMPRQEPDHLVQRKAAAPAVPPRELVQVQEPLPLPAPTQIAVSPILPAVPDRPATAFQPGAQSIPQFQAPARPTNAPAVQPVPVRPQEAPRASAAPAVRPAAQHVVPIQPPVHSPIPSAVVAAIAVASAASPVPAAPHVASPMPAAAHVAGPTTIAKAAIAVAAPANSPPTLSEAQPLLTQVLQMLETGSGDQLLRLLEADARQAPGAQALSRNFEQLVRGARPVHLSQVEFKGEPRDGVLLVTGRIRLHAGETTIGSHGQRLLLRAEFASRGGKVMLTNLSGAPD